MFKQYLSHDKAICQSLIIFYVCCFANLQGQDNLLTTSLSSENRDFSKNTNILDTIINFYGITTHTDTALKVTLLENVMITASDLEDAIVVHSDGFGYYDLPLKQNNSYSVRFEYKGMYTQFLELDTYSNTHISDKLEYLLPARIMMNRNKNPKIKAFYLVNPREKIYWELPSGRFVKDKFYSDSFEVKLEKLQKNH